MVLAPTEHFLKIQPRDMKCLLHGRPACFAHTRVLKMGHDLSTRGRNHEVEGALSGVRYEALVYAGVEINLEGGEEVFLCLLEQVGRALTRCALGKLPRLSLSTKTNEKYSRSGELTCAY